jgi:hypothetical protein
VQVVGMVLALQLGCVKGLPNHGARIFIRSPGACMSIYQLVYASRPQTPFDGLRLAALMYRARQHNAHAGISGVLLYSGEMFVQCLEGDRETVEALMRKIEADPRHGDIVRLYACEVDCERHFRNWSMGCARIDGFNGLQLMRAQWEQEVASLEVTPSPSPGFVLMKSIWDMYKDHGVVDDDPMPEGAAARAADSAQSRH